MKSLRFLLITLIAVSTVSCMDAQVRERVKGSGDIKTEKRNLDGFTGVKTSTAIDIYLTQGNGFDVEVEADDNIIDYIRTDIDDGILKVYLDKGISLTWHKTMIVHVTMPDIEYIKATSAGDVIGQNLINADELKISTSSSGDVKVEVKANKLQLSTSSSGDISIKGSADFLDGSSSSAGDIKGSELTVREADLSSSSAGDIRITVTEKLKARASSAGDIIYMGNPEFVDAKSSSAGDVIKR